MVLFEHASKVFYFFLGGRGGYVLYGLFYQRVAINVMGFLFLVHSVGAWLWGFLGITRLYIYILLQLPGFALYDFDHIFGPYCRGTS